jgi:hypothetical protein
VTTLADLDLPERVVAVPAGPPEVAGLSIRARTELWALRWLRKRLAEQGFTGHPEVRFKPHEVDAHDVWMLVGDPGEPTRRVLVLVP